MSNETSLDSIIFLVNNFCYILSSIEDQICFSIKKETNNAKANEFVNKVNKDILSECKERNEAEWLNLFDQIRDTW